MEAHQRDAILRAIAVSSLPSLDATPSTTGTSTTIDRSAAFAILEDFKRYDQRVPVVLNWLSSQSVYYQTHDITVATKLLSLEIVSTFLQRDYATLTEPDRLSLRHAILQACRVVAWASIPQNSSSSSSSSLPNGSLSDLTPATPQQQRVLAKKLATILEGLVVRDFPQRWNTFASDIFTPMAPNSISISTATTSTTTTTTAAGGLWYAWDTTTGRPVGGHIHLGVNVCLECLKLIAEDCTDSDFNSKISTQRRNDVLIGLNEVSDSFVPLIFELLQHAYPLLLQSKATLHSMHQYLVQNGRTTRSMTPDEQSLYQKEIQNKRTLTLLLADAFTMLEKFASSFPLPWLLNPSRDFIPAILFVLRERQGQIQVRAIECLETLSNRGKLEYKQWIRLIRELPDAVQQANQAFPEEYDHQRLEEVATQQGNNTDNDSTDTHGGALLALQLDFHRALCKLLSSVVTSHLAFLTTTKAIANRGPDFDSLQAYLRLLVEILHHPSGRMCSEQVSMWTTLCRDPQTVKTKLLDPFFEPVLGCYLDQMVRVRWSDVESQSHTHYHVLEASFDDEDDYDTWMNDLRSKCSNLFKFMGNAAPVIASRVLLARVQKVLMNHGAGQPLDHLEPSNRQLTQQSDAVLQLEALQQPLDNTLSGIPSWALAADVTKFSNSPDRLKVATEVRQLLSELAREVVAWSPTHLWLRFRRAFLLDPLKYIWNYDTSTLLQAIDSLLRYLGLPDEWQGGSTTFAAHSSTISGETLGLKKKSGVTLVAISKKIPQHLVPWLAQLSEATRSLLSSDGLIPLNQMHLYEFLTCVAAAVEDPLARARFVADVLLSAVETIESTDVQQLTNSAAALMNTFGIANATPASVSDPAVVNAITAQYIKLFSSFNRLLSVGRRCSETAKLHQPSTSQPHTNGSDFAAMNLNFPDEGPVSLQELAVSDPFVPLWPRILPPLLTLYEAILCLWRPEHQAKLLAHPLQRYVYAISDDEVFLARTQDGKTGGVFGEGGTAGMVVAGTDRRSQNLLPKWSGWFNELRNTCFQLLALASAQRVLFAPELASLFPRVVAVLTDPLNLRSMEHRHTVQFLKHVVELLLLCCPSTLYVTHLAPILGPIVEHMRYRLDKTWLPVLDDTTSDSTPMTKALTSQDCLQAAGLASQGGEAWFSWYYAHAGLFVGDTDDVLAEAAVEKYRVELGRTYSDVLQTALALKGDWALVLANQAKEDHAVKRNDPTILMAGPSGRINDDGVPVNADGTVKSPDQVRSDARKLLRINKLCHFLLLESEVIAFNVTLTVVQCLGYPDAYTCRRITKICHRILETVAWSPLYSQILGDQMFSQAVKNIVTEPKWMVGLEWDVINGTCRAVLLRS